MFQKRIKTLNWKNINSKILIMMINEQCEANLIVVVWKKAIMMLIFLIILIQYNKECIITDIQEITKTIK